MGNLCVILEVKVWSSERLAQFTDINVYFLLQPEILYNNCTASPALPNFGKNLTKRNSTLQSSANGGCVCGGGGGGSNMKNNSYSEKATEAMSLHSP